MQHEEETYRKTGTAGAEGVDYQLNLILHVLLQVKKLELDSFKLYTELKTAGKFDDIVLIFEDENKKERCCLLQAKHVIDESKTISFNELVNDDKYKLTKYFDSFKELIKEIQFKDSLEHLILFTNLNLSQSLLPYVEEVQPPLPIWNCQTVKGNEKKPQLYKLNSKFIDEFIDQYSQQVPCKKSKFSSKSKGSNSLPIPFNHIDKNQFTIFCSYLILAVNQPNDGELEDYLTSECAKCFGQLMANIAKGRTKENIRKWFKEKESLPLTCKFLEDAIKYLAEHEKEFTDLYVRSEIAEIFNQTIEFQTLSLIDDIKMFINVKGKKLLQITTRNSDLSSIKTIACLSNLNHEYLFTSKSKIRELTKVFSTSTCYNVFVWSILANSESDLHVFLYSLNDIIDDIKDKSKKVIVIMNEGQSLFGRQLEAPEDWIQRINDETQYRHLTEDARNKLLKKNVSFQGCDIEINKILLHDFRLDQVAHDSWGELLCSGNISIGRKVNLSKEYNSNYYIQRSIVLTNTNTGTKQPFNEEEFIQHALPNGQRLSNEANIRSNCEIFILSDPAGMGKTTVTSSLADEIKCINPHYGVTRLVAMECASELNNFDESTRSDASYDDFFMSNLLKLSSPLERFVLGQYLKNDKSVNKLVLIFDGYDEINEKCQRVIVNLLQYLSRKPDIGFIVITTRPQFQQDLEEHFQQKACILRPFDEKNKIEFLRRYWTSTGIKENNHRLTEYAEQLIKCISDSITEEESQLTGIPLQMRMIAEIYEQDARSYVQNEQKDLRLSTMSLGLFDLYEKFMKNKEEICLKDKLEDKGTAFNTKMIKSLQQHQTKFAREIILGRPVSKVETTDLELATQLGIIQKNPAGQFYFIHRTFAEFLTAKYLLDDLIENDSVPVADKIKNGLLIKQIKKGSLYVVRKFINSRLNSAKLAEECKRSDDKRALQKLLGYKCWEIIATSAEEEIYEFIKLTIEVNSWLRPDQIFYKLQESLWIVKNNSKWVTAILNCILDKWLPTKDVILMKTIDHLIRFILVEENKNMFDRSKLTISTIDFQNKLESNGVLAEEDLRKILSNARDDVVNRRKYWNWRTIDYFKHLISTHRNLFYDFLNHNRTLLHTIMKKCKPTDSRDFLLLIQSDKEIDANWVINKLIEDKFVEFRKWEDEHFELYFSILHSTVGQLNSERKEKFRNYLEEVIHIIYRQYDLSWKGLFTKFLMHYETMISLDVFVSKFDKTKTIEELEYCVLWGQTNKLKEILEVGDIEAAAVERFQLVGGAEDLAATRRSILNSIKERQGEEEFLQWIGQRNWLNLTILQRALLKGDDLIIELISEWIKTQEIFEKIMRMDYDITYYTSEVVLFLNFVNDKFPQYRMKFLEINKNNYLKNSIAREEIFRIIENNENIGKIEFVQILKLQIDYRGYEGETILNRILIADDIGILLKSLNLMKKFSLDSETITQLFRIKNVNKSIPLVYIQRDSNYVRRQKKKKICVDFFSELNLFELKEEIENLEKQADIGSDSGDESGSEK